MGKKKRTSIIITLVVIFILLIFFGNIINFIVNVEWFNEVGYLSVYFTKLVAVLKLMVPIFIITYIVIWLYYRSIKKSVIRQLKVVEVNARRKSLEKKIFVAVNILISFIVSFTFASSYWYTILQFSNSTNFNIKDPLFNNDISFYVFKLPLIESLYYTAMGVLIFLVIVTFIVYFVLSVKDSVVNNNFEFNRYNRQNRSFSSMKSGITKFAGRQLAIVSALILLLLSVGYVIKAWNLVYSSTGVVYGAGYTDIHVSLLFYRVISVVSIIAAIVIFISVLKSKAKPIVVSVIVIIALMVLEGISSAVVQNLIVKSDEKELESQYIKYNIDNTRKAFNIDKVDSKDINITNDLTGNDIKSNSDIINNIRINSFQPALEFYNQVQTVRYYYKFGDIDVDRYSVNGNYNQVFIAPREIDAGSKDLGTWQNKHLIYTHGYGVVMSKVNTVTSEGKPDFIIKDIPPSNDSGITLNDPRIYFGEKTDEYAIVDTDVSEVDYPKGGTNQTNKYNGRAGINLGLGNRILYSFYENDIKILTSSAINNNSKILINRNVVDRINKIAPFLTYDKDPYAIIADGKLYWIIDAYTSTDKYPYSQPYNDINYIRNSVKVVVDAENGDTNFYIVDKNDPIVNCYSKIFPKLFKDASSLPSSITEHFRYPEDIFSTQCQVLERYHMTDAGIFFNKEDTWDVSTNTKQVDGSQAVQEFPYIITRLPENNKTEMVLTSYFNSKSKANIMSAILDARMDGENYGQLVLYKFPNQSTVSSPYSFKQNINQDTQISSDLSLWNKEGSSVIFGDTIILPVKNSLLYIEPLYLRASGTNSIPEMKRVIVQYSDKLVSADSMEAALSKIFFDNQPYTSQTTQPSTNVTPGTQTVPAEDNTKLTQAKNLLDQAITAQKNGDWAKYGEYINQLQQLLNNSTK